MKHILIINQKEAVFKKLQFWWNQFIYNKDTYFIELPTQGPKHNKFQTKWTEHFDHRFLNHEIENYYNKIRVTMITNIVK